MKPSPGAQDEELRHQKQGLALGNGLINKAVDVAGCKTSLLGKGRPRRIPGQIESNAPRLAKCVLIAVESGYALRRQNHAGKGRAKA